MNKSLIFSSRVVPNQVIKALVKQLEDEVSIVGSTELVKEVNISISDVYYSNGRSQRCHGSSEINMEFYTEFIIKRDKRAGTGGLDQLHGFVSSNTLGRFSRRKKQFYSIDNSMLSSIEIL